jgi:hypothetical protein
MEENGFDTIRIAPANGASLGRHLGKSRDADPQGAEECRKVSGNCFGLVV